MRDVSQIERQLYILTLLSSNKKGYTISEIHNNLMFMGIEVSRRTIVKELNRIEHFLSSTTLLPAMKKRKGNLIPI